MFNFVLLLAFVACGVQSQVELILTPLPYAYDALEPVLSKHLMELHHDKHFQTYTTKTNAALKTLINDVKAPEQLKTLAKQPIETIFSQLREFPEHIQIELRHNAGGYINHKLFFSLLKTPTTTAEENKPTGPLLQAIEKSFGSYEHFNQIFTNASVSLFGSGWVWLYIDAQSKDLVINYTANQDNPIMFDKNHVVILGIDLWEHAYYPVYENRRAEYVQNFWRIINWPAVAKIFSEGQSKRGDL